MKPQNKTTLDELTNRGYELIGGNNKDIKVYHSYIEEKGLIIKQVNQEYRITNQYSIKDSYNKENELWEN
jgi:hypothetical protein